MLQAEPMPLSLDTAPDDPHELFISWLTDAIAAGVIEPHAMTVSTCGADGIPDARVLILKDLDAEAWWFGSRNDAAKGRQLQAVPAAALTFYWPALGRQVRVRGSVTAASPERSAEDFRDRSVGSQAVALTGRQSQPLSTSAEVADTVVAILRRLESGAPAQLAAWTLWGVVAETVEFWSADTGRQHTRLRYARAHEGWTRGLLWP